MIAALVMAAVLQAGWTWTLYEGDGPVVLAEEIPDTPQLRNTLECEPGSGVARLTLYRDGAAGGFVTVAAGQATAQTEAQASDGGVAVPLRLDHPVFAAFQTGGSIAVRSGETSWTLELPQDQLGKLRRFGELCSG